MMELEKTIEQTHNMEKELSEHKIKLMKLELNRDVESAKYALKTKEEWKELNITNAEGRKAFIDIQLNPIKDEIIQVKTDIQRCEVDLKNLKRILDYQFWKYSQGDF